MSGRGVGWFAIIAGALIALFYSARLIWELVEVSGRAGGPGTGSRLIFHALMLAFGGALVFFGMRRIKFSDDS